MEKSPGVVLTRIIWHNPYHQGPNRYGDKSKQKKHYLPACECIAGVVLESEGRERANDRTGSGAEIPQSDTWWLFASLIPHGRDKDLIMTRVSHYQLPGCGSSELCLVSRAYYYILCPASEGGHGECCRT